MATKKTKKPKKAVKKTSTAGLKAFKVKLAALEKEITRSAGNEAMEDMMEDKVEVLEKEVKMAAREEKINKIDADVLLKELDRLEDMTG